MLADFLMAKKNRKHVCRYVDPSLTKEVNAIDMQPKYQVETHDLLNTFLSHYHSCHFIFY